MRNVLNTIRNLCLAVSLASLCVWPVGLAAAEAAPQPLELQPLIEEALKNNHDVWVSEARWRASTSRIGPAGSLPDPMVMIGYQNEGWNEYTFGKMEGAQWMYGVQQMFPFPGKRSLKEKMASRDAETAGAMHRAARLGTAARVKELYFDLFLAHKNIDLVRERSSLFTRIEEAALARYATGMAPQQEVLMAQTEKYMLLERETMLEQKRRSLEAMLIGVLGRDSHVPLGRPAEPAATPFAASADDLTRQALESSPEVQSREKMLSASQAGVHMAEKEYYPDVTLTGLVSKRSGEFEDMWSILATFNIPLYYKSRQSQLVAEARSMQSAAVHDLAGIKAMLASTVRDNHSMVQSSDRLMELYRKGLIPKTNQEFELALTGYQTGKIEEIVVVSRLKSLLDYETSYWTQFVEREKAIARLEALTAAGNNGSGAGSQEPGARSQE